MSNEMILDPEQLVKRSSDIIASEVDGEMVMMSINQGKYFGLDSIGGDIWKMLESPMKVSDICDRLMKQYKVDEPTCERDVFEFLDQLIEQELINIQ
jgi:hypothetical protein